LNYLICSYVMISKYYLWKYILIAFLMHDYKIITLQSWLTKLQIILIHVLIVLHLTAQNIRVLSILLHVSRWKTKGYQSMSDNRTVHLSSTTTTTPVLDTRLGVRISEHHRGQTSYIVHITIKLEEFRK